MTGIDWAVIAVYLAATIGMGAWLGRKQDDLEDYYLGGRNIPWWAALLSMVATEASAATFLGAPEQGLTRDLTYLQFSIGTVAARFVLASVFIAAFYRLRVFTVYGYLTTRFGVPTQGTTAAVFLLGRLFASGARLFIAAIAIEVATGLDMRSSIVLLGIVAVAYTLFGGIKAVVWTDVLQAIVLIGGGVIALVHLYGITPLSGGEIWGFLSEHEKLRVFDLDWRTVQGDLAFLYNPYHILPAVIGGFFLTMATHGTDHDMVQRLLTCRDSADGQRSLWVSGFVSVVVTCLFLGVGLLLFVYLQHLAPSHPMAERASELAAQGRNGHVFLYYIVDVLPVGVGGLVLAAVFAAAMSSLDSAMSAMSATFVSDFYRPFFRPEADQRHYLRVGRWATGVVGVLLVGVALMVVHYYEANPDTDLLSIALGVMTFFYGALLGIFLLGFMTRTRGNTISNALGALASMVTVFLIKSGTGLGWPWFIVIGTLIAFGVAFAGRTAANLVTQSESAR
ncbi:MAG: sodium/solute symporter [Gemmatimonadetes bacterium]|jgi:solute:Na+ symporter, SSS family|nr:sodium/solute symporter [Gemmatimonadota bacterium]MBT7863750.1 sodium/solute symporter [Gemmatimonadota bacterium]